MGEVLPGEAGGVQVGTDRLVDLRTRLCPECGLELNRVEFFDVEGSDRPRVLWACDNCDTWQADAV